MITLLIIALIHTLLVCRKKKTAQKTSPLQWTKEEETAYANNLSTLVQCPTVSTFGGNERAPFAEYHKLLEKTFPKVFAAAEKHVVGDDALILKFRGKSSEHPVMFIAHMDVVPATEPNWTYPPFSGTIADGKVWGRGTCDTKNTAYNFLRAMEELLADGFVPANDIYFGSSDGEEVSGNGAPCIVKWLEEHNVKLDMLLDEGGAIMNGILPQLTADYAVIGVMEKGYADVRFTAVNKSGGHSSTPPKKSPVARLAALINDVEKHNYFPNKMPVYVKKTFEAFAPNLPFAFSYVLSNMWLFKGLLMKLAPIISPAIAAMFHTTICFTMIEGSQGANIIPKKAYATANLRFAESDKPEECFAVLEKLAKKYDLEMEVLISRAASSVTDDSSAGYQMLQRTMSICCPDVVVAPYMVMGGTDARSFSSVTDCALRFTPTRMTMQQMNCTHSNDENIDIKAIAEGVKFYKYMLEHELA